MTVRPVPGGVADPSRRVNGRLEIENGPIGLRVGLAAVPFWCSTTPQTSLRRSPHGHGDTLIRGGTPKVMAQVAWRRAISPSRAGRIASDGEHRRGPARQIIDAKPASRWRRASSTSRPIPTLPCRSIPRPRTQGAPGRHHRDHRPLRLLGRAALCRARSSACATISVASRRRGCPFKRDRRFRNTSIRFPATAVNAGMLVGHNTPTADGDGYGGSARRPRPSSAR